MNHDALLALLEQRPDIDGRFSRLRRVGNGGGIGGFSALVSADDNTRSARVALKVCLPFQETYRAESFAREAQLLELLSGQPDIIQLIAARAQFVEMLMAHGGLQIPLPLGYYAVELAAGDFSDVIANGGWPPLDTLRAFRALCRALQRIHAPRIVHRDLKPSNLLVMEDRTVRLSDFGTARRIDPSTPPLLRSYSGPPGDRRYCAPEMLALLHDEDASIAFMADFFSLGAVLFEMFSGTILGLRLFTPQFWADIAQAMLAVKAGERRKTYDKIVASIANSRPIPSIADFGAPVPASIRDRIDDLCRSLSAVDYRRRLCDFDRIFNRINTCIVILENETAYQRWVANKKRRRAAHLRPSGVTP